MGCQGVDLVSLFLEGDESMHCSFFVWPFVFEDSLKYLLLSVAKK